MKVYDIFGDGDIQYILGGKGDNIQKLRQRRFVEIQCVLFCLKYCIIFETNSNVVGAAEAGNPIGAGKVKELELHWSYKSWKKKAGKRKTHGGNTTTGTKGKKRKRKRKKRTKQKRELLLRT